MSSRSLLTPNPEPLTPRERQGGLSRVILTSHVYCASRSCCPLPGFCCPFSRSCCPLCRAALVPL